MTISLFMFSLFVHSIQKVHWYESSPFCNKCVCLLPLTGNLVKMCVICNASDLQFLIYHFNIHNYSLDHKSTL